MTAGFRRDGLRKPSANGRSTARYAKRGSSDAGLPRDTRIVGMPTIKVLLEVRLDVTASGANQHVAVDSPENVGAPTFQVSLEGFSNPIEVRE
jgi:hypothetical protein